MMLICLTGMHRSGTSLMASYFHHCGIDMGEKLVGSAKGNRRGHFEDIEFVEFHDAILLQNHCHMYTPRKHLSIPAALSQRATDIIREKQSRNGIVGWKDPRSSLFLRLWHQINPATKFVLLYRNPYAVIDSLRRRGSDRRIFALPWIPAKAWLRYNTDLLAFHRTADTNSILINIDGFNHSSKSSTQLLAEWLGIKLGTPYSDVYHTSELSSSPQHRSSRPISGLIDSLYTKQIDRLYQDIESVAAITTEGISGKHQQPGRSNPEYMDHLPKITKISRDD